MDLDLLICNDSVQVHKQFRLPKDARHPLWADVNASDFKCDLNTSGHSSPRRQCHFYRARRLIAALCCHIRHCLHANVLCITGRAYVTEILMTANAASWQPATSRQPGNLRAHVDGHLDALEATNKPTLESSVIDLLNDTGFTRACTPDEQKQAEYLLGRYGNTGAYLQAQHRRGKFIAGNRRQSGPLTAKQAAGRDMVTQNPGATLRPGVSYRGKQYSQPMKLLKALLPEHTTAASAVLAAGCSLQRRTLQ